MKTGKLAESILKRSILKYIKSRRQEIIQGAAVGGDCAFFSFSEKDLACTVSSFCVYQDIPVVSQVEAAMNNIAAGGGRPISLLVSAIFPEEISEEGIREIMAQIEEACKKHDVQIAGGDTRISTYVSLPQLTVTVLGEGTVLKNPEGTYKVGQEIVMTKWTGLLGTAMLARKKREVLLERLPVHLIETAVDFDRYTSVIPEAAWAIKSGVSGMHDVSRGGVFTALWELAERAGAGLEIDLKQLPVRQETIEICEVLGVNPYELYGAGSLLIVCDRGSELVEKLKEEKIPAAVIGKITKEKGKVISNQDEIRYLDRPVGDSLEKLLG